MMNFTATRPEASEYAPFYASYILLVPEGDVIATLTRQLEDVLTLLGGISDAEAETRYAPGKWSIKEVIGHITDTERIFAYRALRFARADRTPLPGYEQDDYVRHANFDALPINDIAAGFEHVRRATLSLLRSFDDGAWRRVGVANDKEVSVRALAYIIAGHVTHHTQIIRAKYL